MLFMGLHLYNVEVKNIVGHVDCHTQIGGTMIGRPRDIVARQRKGEIPRRSLIRWRSTLQA